MFKNIFRKKEVINYEEQFAEWVKNGRPMPPPHVVKQKAIKEFQKKFHTEILIETGTYLGDMIDAQKIEFQKIYSIELSERLYNKARKRFKEYGHITILHGDSGIVLNKLIPKLDKPALFWLDGHYSGGVTAKGIKECPVIEELETILKSHLPHVILIDDARLFNGTNDYPTIKELKNILNKSNRPLSLEVKDDIIRLTPDS